MKEREGERERKEERESEREGGWVRMRMSEDEPWKIKKYTRFTAVANAKRADNLINCVCIQTKNKYNIAIINITLIYKKITIL